MKQFQLRRRNRPLLAALLAFGGVLAAQAAETAKTASSRSDAARMTDLQVQMLPFGTIFEMLGKDDPNWPMQENPDAVTPEQLGCLRGELSTSGYRRYKQTQVDAYVAADPARAKAEIALLERGAAELFGKLVLAGAESERSGATPNPEALLKDATPDQLASFMAFFGDPNYAELRKLSGLGDAIAADKSPEQNQSAGEKLGSAITVQVMLNAMSTCQVPTSVLFDR